MLESWTQTELTSDVKRSKAEVDPILQQLDNYRVSGKKLSASKFKFPGCLNWIDDFSVNFLLLKLITNS